MKQALLVVAAALVPGAAAAQQPSAPTVLANVQTFYATASHMTAKFRQVVTHPAFGTTQQSDGEVRLAKPAQLRWDYKVKKQQVVTTSKSFVFDGKALWLVDHPNKQIVKTAASQSVMPAAVAFLTNAQGLAKQFTVSVSTAGTYGGKGDIVLELVPKQASAAYKQVYFVVDKVDGHVRESVVIAPNGDTSDFQFYTPDLQAAIAPDLFAVDPKAFPTYKLVVAGAGKTPVGAGSARP